MLKRILLILTAFLLNFHEVKCCECYRKNKITVENFNSYQSIFIGTLIKESTIEESKSEKGNYRRTGFYKVIKNYKGTLIGDTVLIYDNLSIGACGLGRLTIGRDYLIFSNGKNVRWTSACTRTTYVPLQTWPNDSAIINNQKRLSSFGEIYDTALTNFHADTIFLNKHVLVLQRTSLQKFYDENGKISAIGRYKNGLPEGFWKYYNDGESTDKGNYINGDKDSLWVELYNKDMVYVNEYKNGEYTYRESLFYEGKLSKKTSPIPNSRKWEECAYFSNGNVRFIAETNPPYRDKHNNLKKGIWDGFCKTYNQNGILLSSGLIQNGLLVKHWRFYYEDGKLRMEGNYIRGKKSGIWKILYPNHMIKAMGKYVDDEKFGNWKYFDKNNKGISSDPNFIKEDEDDFTYSGEKNL